MICVPALVQAPAASQILLGELFWLNSLFGEKCKFRLTEMFANPCWIQQKFMAKLKKKPWKRIGKSQNILFSCVLNKPFWFFLSKCCLVNNFLAASFQKWKRLKQTSEWNKMFHFWSKCFVSYKMKSFGGICFSGKQISLGPVDLNIWNLGSFSFLFLTFFFHFSFLLSLVWSVNWKIN